MSIEKIIDDFSLINDQIVKYLEVRLQEWAIWNLKKENPNLDYPSESIEYQIMTLGVLSRQKYKTPKPMPVHERAEEMEAIISVMARQGDQASEYAAALREYYIGKGRGSKAKAAKQLGIAVEVFRRSFKGALIWLKGWLTGYYGAQLLVHK